MLCFKDCEDFPVYYMKEDHFISFFIIKAKLDPAPHSVEMLRKEHKKIVPNYPHMHD